MAFATHPHPKGPLHGVPRDDRDGVRLVRTDARFAREKQVPRFARNGKAERRVQLPRPSATELFEAGAVGDVFCEGGEDRLAAFFAGREEHAMGLEAAHFAGGEVGDDDDLAAYEFFRGVELGDAGEDLAAAFGAEVDFEAEELVGFGDALGEEDFGYAEFDFDEVVDGDRRGFRV